MSRWIENAVLTAHPSGPRGVGNAEELTVPAQVLSLPQNFVWTLAGNVTYMGCQWGMLVVLARLGDPEMLGRFALAFALTAPVFQFANLQLRELQATDACNENSFGEYLGLRLIMIVLALAAVGGICLVAGYRPEVVTVTLWIGAAKGFEAISDVYYGRMQFCQRMDKIAKSMMFKGCVSLALLALGIAWTGSLAWGAAMLAASWAAVLAMYDARVGGALVKSSERRPSFPIARLRSLAVKALPLGVVMLLLSLKTNIPRYVVEVQLGEGALGIFAALAALMVAGNAVVNALGQSVLPRLAVHAAGGQRREFRKLLRLLLTVAAGLGLATVGGAWIAGRWFLTIAYGTEYAAHMNTFLWLMAAAAAAYFFSFAGFALTALQEFRVQMILQIVNAAISAALAIVLVQRYGLPGAGMAVLATMVIGAVTFAIPLWRKIGLNP